MQIAAIKPSVIELTKDGRMNSPQKIGEYHTGDDEDMLRTVVQASNGYISCHVSLHLPKITDRLIHGSSNMFMSSRSHFAGA